MVNNPEMNYKDIQNILSNKISVTEDLHIMICNPGEENEPPFAQKPSEESKNSIEFIQMIQ